MLRSNITIIIILKIAEDYTIMKYSRNANNQEKKKVEINHIQFCPLVKFRVDNRI